MEWFPCFYGCPHIGPSSQDCTQCEFDILDLSVRRLHAESPELERASTPSTNEREEGFGNDALMAADWRQLGTALWYSLLPTDHPAANTGAGQGPDCTQAEETTEKARVDLFGHDEGEHSDEDTEEGGAKLW